MHLPDDDELYEIDQSYLGPPDRYIGVFRYRSIGIGIILFPFALVLLRQAGLPLNLFTGVFVLAALARLTQIIADHATYERPVWALMGQFWADVRAPREDRTVQAVSGAGFAERLRPIRAVQRSERRSQRRATKREKAESS